MFAQTIQSFIWVQTLDAATRVADTNNSLCILGADGRVYFPNRSRHPTSRYADKGARDHVTQEMIVGV